MQNPDPHKFLFVECLPAAGCVPLDLFDGLPNVFEAKAVVPHSGTASRRTVARTRSRKPREETTSTLEASKLSNSRCSPLRSNKLRPGSRSTRKSISLRVSLSPRATDPNTRIVRAPRRVAMRMISSRFVARRSASVMLPLSLCRSRLQDPHPLPHLPEHFEGAIQLGPRVRRRDDSPHARFALGHRREPDARGQHAFLKQFPG